MTKEQLIEISTRYCEHLNKMGIKNENGCLFNKSELPVTKENTLLHIKWMCSVIPDLIKQNKIEKAMRWIGFVQGVLYTHNIFTIDDMKNHNN